MSDIKELKSQAEYRAKLLEINSKISEATKLDDIIIDLKDEITNLFEADRLTIYYVDGIKRELVSRFKTGNEISEIRVPLSSVSISGYAAFKNILVNIENVYDKKELAEIDQELKFDSSWDIKTGYTTKQVLVVPIIYKNIVLGAIQLINSKLGRPFSSDDENNVTQLARIIGIGIFNQKRMATARIAKKNKFDYLLENHILTQKELNNAIKKARENRTIVENILRKELKISKSDIGNSLSKYFKINFIEYNKNMAIPGELLKGLKPQFLRKNFWVPLRVEDGKTLIVIDNPHDLQKIGEIKSWFKGKDVKFSVALRDDILEYIKLFTQDEKELASMDEIMGQLQADEDEVDEEEKGFDEESSAIVLLVNKIILDAYARNASDIHIEPYPGKANTNVRIRVDGSCTLYQTIPFHYKNAIVSRIKIMADLDIAERRKPQDGKIKFKKYGGKDIELRVATVPTQGGLEDVVMRILAAGDPIPLDKMGFSKENYENFVNCITKPYGIVFVCGPTGSGKTTTLHSALGYINKIETKIWTAEDPVEITQKGLRQVQVQPKIGFDFAAAMRAFLRADPDVIMVGEMRDHETTQIGIEASLTGHLVFSTLHTNSAPESVTRLLDMGMDPFNFADAILCILAQRLVRTLCKHCKKEYHPSEEEFDELVREYGVEEFGKTGIKYSDSLKIFRTDGCDKCNNTGYSGRMGLHELLIGSDEVKKMIQNSVRMEEIKAQAIKEGMVTLKQDGIKKIFSGNCDLLQVRKVCIK